MSLAVKQPQGPQQNPAQRPLRRIWRAPASRTKWLWLVVGVLVYGGIYAWFYMAAHAAGAEVAPINEPFLSFGIVSYVLVLGTAAYSLRRRFVRGLPGKVQSWLWMHTWIGISAILIALLHENYTFVTSGFVQKLTDLTDTYWAGAALFALIFLVVSGVSGRLLDLWQTHLIAREANINGVGIVQALEERILELEYTVERLCAGKSEPFKEYCLQALSAKKVQQQKPSLSSSERIDFQRAHETLNTRAILVQSRQRQERARTIIRAWRSAHIVLACASLLIISYHGIMELLVNVFHVIKGQ